jgi:RNA polymerase sigma factor (sigma-70 family)
VRDEAETAEAALDPGVMATLVHNHRRFLAFLERRVESREVAEELLQDAFVRSCEKGGELRQNESAVAWFYRLLRNAIVDHHRRTAAAKRATDRLALEAAEAPDEELREEICRCVGELIDTLKPEYAEAIRRIDLGGASVKRFAEEESISASNAGVRVHRARRALRRQLERSCGSCAVHGCLDCQCGSAAGAPSSC